MEGDGIRDIWYERRIERLQGTIRGTAVLDRLEDTALLDDFRGMVDDVPIELGDSGVELEAALHRICQTPLLLLNVR